MSQKYTLHAFPKTLLLFLLMTFNRLTFGEEKMTAFEKLQELEKIYDLIIPAQENSHESFVWFSGIPHIFFNTVILLKTNENLREKVEALISLAPRNVPISFWVHNQNGLNNLPEILKEKGFQSIITCPLMTWEVESVPLPNHRIEKADLAIFHHLLSTTFNFDDIVKDGWSKLLVNIEAENYLIYHDDQPIGTGTIIANDRIGGILNIAILPEYQKRGYGLSMMLFLMNRASILGLETLVLLSSPQAEKLYSGLKFIKCMDIEIYAK